MAHSVPHDGGPAAVIRADGAGIVVVGGGLAGAAAAGHLARAGRAVTVMERDAGPADRICGEFLSVEAQAALRGLGVDPAALGGHRITHVRLVRGRRAATAALPFVGLGLSRRVLDAALLSAAEAQGARVLRGRAVTAADGTTLHLNGGERMEAGSLLLATGKHDLRGLARAPRAAPDKLVGFKTYLRLTAEQTAELAGHVEITMFSDCYVGLQLVEGGRANLCLLVKRARLHRVGRDWAALLDSLRADSAHFDRRLAGSVHLRERPLTIYRVPYGYVHQSDPAAHPGVFRLGDQAAVIASFTGDGMAIALHSAGLAAGALLRGVDAARYHRRLARDLAGQIGRANALYRLGRVPGGQTMMVALARLFPPALTLAARLTRVGSG